MRHSFTDESTLIRCGFRKSLSLVFVLVNAACGHSIVTAPEGPGNLGKFEKVWHDFDAHYAYFEVGHIDWTAIGAKYRPLAADAASEKDLASIIGAMIGELRDYHADLTTPYGTFGAPPIAYPRHFEPAVVQTYYFKDPIRSTPSGRIQYTTLVDGTGYVFISTFAGTGWGSEIVTALDALSAVPALVIDIRNNLGGNEDIALEIASHFTDSRRTYRLAQFRNGPGHNDFGSTSTFTMAAHQPRFPKPVALVTNRYNGSASEDFTLMMRVLPTVVTVGDTTLGLGSNPLGISLSNGWSYRVPQSIQKTPDGFVYQWRGLPPRIPVAWSEAEVAAGRDPYLEAALAELRRMRG